jgi:hypothetical protein
MCRLVTLHHLDGVLRAFNADPDQVFRSKWGGSGELKPRYRRRRLVAAASRNAGIARRRLDWKYRVSSVSNLTDFSICTAYKPILS